MIDPQRVSVELACPPAHAVTRDPAEIVLEPHVGGRIYERTSGGEAMDWGQIAAWEPPHRLSYRWHIRRDRAHTGWERLGAEAERWRDANRGGWSGLLPVFVAACTDFIARHEERSP